jgi:fatty acyl-CoA reductase
MPLPSILAKVHAIAGDCSYKDLNLAPADRATIAGHTTMIFHFAATVKFNEKFKRAIELNVRGIREMIRLALECPHLQLFCHVSTAFCHLEEKHLLERVYDAAADPNEIIEVAEKFGEDEVEKMLSSHLCEHVPNTYVFTKGLSESLVMTAQRDLKLPAMIVRPAVMMSVCRDPLPGWTDNINNVNGTITAAAMGVMRNYMNEVDVELNVYPVDYSISNIMACTWNFLSERSVDMGVGSGRALPRYFNLLAIFQTVIGVCRESRVGAHADA